MRYLISVCRYERGGGHDEPTGEPGDVFRVTERPYAEFQGVVEEVPADRNTLRVSVLIFGRATPVQLEFSQVQKL
jgi:transcriptional antiterminator NusG